MTYPFQPVVTRAQCLNVVDGDTCDLLVDHGFNHLSVLRFRLHGVNTPELKSKDPEESARAQKAREQLTAWLKPSALSDLSTWNLKVKTFKTPDSFGRWLAEIWCFDSEGQEICVNQELINRGLAAPYRR